MLYEFKLGTNAQKLWRDFGEGCVSICITQRWFRKFVGDKSLKNA